ncbi:MAG: phosphoadenylyl-sulfate reductase [Opitutales bacterium]
MQPPTLPHPEMLSVESERLERLSAEDRVRWAIDTFGSRLVLSTSFGIQSAVMLHLVTRLAPEIPVVFVDTGYLFPETYQFADELTRRLNLNLKVFNPRETAARQEALHGRLWEQGKDGLEKYNLLNKVEPMNRAIQELGAAAWLTGLRRVQSKTREDLDIIHLQKRTYKIHPILDWSERDVYQYLTKHQLPYHPLWEKGYVSVGDIHSSAPLGAGQAAEETRFNGLKRECGLHEANERGDFQI